MRFISPQELPEVIEKLLSSPSREVKIATPWAGGFLPSSLLHLIPKGVKLEIVLRASKGEDLKITPPDFFKELEFLKAHIFLHKSLHAKFLIVDNKVALLGSSNFTDKGLNRFKEGNREANLLIEEPKEVLALSDYFETLKGESLEVSPSLVGFTLSQNETKRANALLFKPVEEEAFLLLKGEKATYLAKVEKLISLSPTIEWEKEIFKTDSPSWQAAYLFATLGGGERALYLASLTLLGRLENSLLKEADIPPAGGVPLFLAGDLEILAKSSKKAMSCPLKVGRGKIGEVYLDLAAVWSRHCAVLGITGSGKSFLTQRVISRAVKTSCGVYFTVLDPQGEYGQALKELLGEEFEKLVSLKEVPNVLLPLSLEDFASLLEFLGFSHLFKGTSKEVKLLRDKVASYLRTLWGEREKNTLGLGQFLLKLSQECKGLSQEIEALVGEMELYFGKEALNNQPQAVRLLKEEPKRVVEIYDLSKILDPTSFLNAAAVVLKKLFIRKGKKHIIVVEEAHNFAPERGFGEVPSSRRNLSLVMLERIAAQGRKLSLGLWLVAQRPAQVSKYVLSQANTFFLFKLTDRNDLSAVETYLSAPLREKLTDKLPFLETGKCLAGGVGFPFELTLKVE